MRVIPELRQISAEFPSLRALVKGERKVTLVELVDSVNRLAGYLRSIGIIPGDRVAIWVPNCIEFVYAYFAILQIGAVCVPVDIRIKKEGLLQVISETASKALFTIAPLLQAVGGIGEINKNTIVITVDQPAEGTHHLAAAMSAQSPDLDIAPRAESDDAIILYTSGTAGRSKGVVLTYSHMSLFPETMKVYIKNTEVDSCLCVLPMSHISGPILCNLLALHGTGIVIMDTMNPDAVLEGIEKHKPTIFHCVPTIFNFLLNSRSFSQRDLNSLRVVSMMGESVPLWLMHKYRDALPKAKVIQGYGLTETSPQVTLVPIEDAERKMGSIGKAAPQCEVAVMDKNGKLEPPRVIGEIVVRGPQVMKGYYLNPEKTSEVIRGGWFHSGDLGWMDKEGFFYHAGRADGVINTGGLMVYPPEVEHVISQHPDVIEAAVDSIPDPKRGQIVRARVVLKPGSTVKPEDILAFARPHIESYKMPRKIEVVDSLEKSSTGKVQRQ